VIQTGITRRELIVGGISAAALAMLTPCMTAAAAWTSGGNCAASGGIFDEHGILWTTYNDALPSSVCRSVNDVFPQGVTVYAVGACVSSMLGAEGGNCSRLDLLFDSREGSQDCFEIYERMIAMGATVCPGGEMRCDGLVINDDGIDGHVNRLKIGMTIGGISFAHELLIFDFLKNRLGSYCIPANGGHGTLSPIHGAQWDPVAIINGIADSGTYGLVFDDKILDRIPRLINRANSHSAAMQYCRRMPEITIACDSRCLLDRLRENACFVEALDTIRQGRSCEQIHNILRFGPY
jgi:hypothetical protein